MKTLIQELRDLLGEQKCPPGRTWNPKHKRCAPSSNAPATVGFRAGKRGPSHHPHAGGTWGGSKRGGK